MKKNLMIVAVLSILSLFLIAGCSSSTKSGDKKESLPKGISVASSSVGGTYHIWMTGWGQIINQKLGVNVGIETGGGPVGNVQLVNDKKADLASVTMGPAYEGYTGTGWAEGKKYTDIRTIFPMFQSYLHWWVLPKSNIQSVNDFNGKVISNGPAQSSPDLYGKRVIEELGIKPSRMVAGQLGDLNQQLRDGLLSAAAVMSGLPNPSVVEMVKTDKAIIIGVAKADAEKIAAKYGITVGEIPANTYATQPNPVTTLTMWNSVIAHKDLSEEFVYQLVKTTFENQAELVKVHPSAAEVQLDNAKFISSVPMHKGAIRYYEEKGIQLPDSAYPPEYPKKK